MISDSLHRSTLKSIKNLSASTFLSAIKGLSQFDMYFVSCYKDTPRKSGLTSLSSRAFLGGGGLPTALHTNYF